MSSPKVSIIIPVYQVVSYLERAIDSVLNQTLKEIEIILVDDGSDDGSEKICDQYAQKYPNLIKVVHKKNEGLGEARNTGIKYATGDYIAFIDSDDTIDSSMYEEMYSKALEGDYDIVMCDVRIICVESGKEVEVSTYSRNEIELTDYLVNGNNITYSVNKLFSKKIWEEHCYPQIVFEDIAIIPALVTLYTRCGYVPKAFYNYYRRENTLSTSVIGKMSDIVIAFKKFIELSSPVYRKEIFFCIAKQLVWNINVSRPIFIADFVDLLKEYRKDFLINSYIEADNETKKLFELINLEIIPNNIICVDYENALSEEYLLSIKENFPDGKFIFVHKNNMNAEKLPPSVMEAYDKGVISFVEEYFLLKTLYENGGIVIQKNMIPNVKLRKLRMKNIFFGFENHEKILTDCFGAIKEHYIIEALLETYWEHNIYNQAHLSLQERLRDYLIVNYNLNVNGKNQLLKNEVNILLPSILAYDMKDDENMCKINQYPSPEGFEIVDEGVLQLWSQRLLDNWNLYKKEKNSKKSDLVMAGNVKRANDYNQIINQEIVKQMNNQTEQKIQQIIDNYEKSTCWKITKPLRLVGNFLRRKKK